MSKKITSHHDLEVYQQAFGASMVMFEFMTIRSESLLSPCLLVSLSSKRGYP
jgi:hypothetical protein